MKLKRLEVTGGEGGVFLSYRREIKVGTAMERFGGSGFGRKGERKARAREGLDSTQKPLPEDFVSGGFC